jgi:beta-glucosidase
MVVLISNFAYSINWTHENIPAILHLTHNSQELGSALADAIFGDINPGGRLIQTWPRTIDQLPPMMDYNIRNGRTYMYFKGEPLYPFGYGLSYTTFAYSNLKVTDEIIKKQDKIIVSASIKNTGKCAGDEVAQLYIQHLDSKIKRPIKELKGFTRITLKPGETRMVHFELKIDDLKYWNTSKQNWTLEKDKIKIMVGTSSANIKLENTIEVQ